MDTFPISFGVAPPGSAASHCLLRFAMANTSSWTQPARCWGAYGTPPAALALQRLQHQQQPRQQGSRRPPLGRALSRAPASTPMYCGGVGGGGRVLALSSSAESDGGDKDGVDIWRDSILRYAGYANEVGESFRNIAPRLVVPSYAVSFAYVLGDTIDKGYKDFSDGKGAVAVGKMGFDVLLWQTLASVAVPGLTINMVVRATSAAMESGPAKRVLSKVARKWTPTAIGLGIIPFIVHPIDEAVTWGMDETVRKWLA